MAPHAYWQGQIRIALVQLPVSLITATRRASQMPLHEYDRDSGGRIHHRDVTEDGAPVESDSIVKGYELAKNDVVFLEDDEIQNLKLPSSDLFEIDSFVPLDAIPLYYFERPYYVLPEGKSANEIYRTIHEALRHAGKAGIGQLALRGREELCALVAIEQGLMIETLRYQAELLDPDEAFAGVAIGGRIKADYARLAGQLIGQNSRPLDLAHYRDHYHEALAGLVEAKKHHRKPPAPKQAAAPKVTDFMQALQKSLGNAPKARRRAA